MLPTLARMERGKLSFVKYINITARATRQALKEEERVKSDKRGDVGLRYQEWTNGKGGDQKWVKEPTAEA